MQSGLQAAAFASQHHKSLRRAWGFSLLEALIGVAIITIVLAMGVPAFAGLTQKTALRAEQDELFAAIQYARQLAVETASRVVVCPSTTQDECIAEPNWHEGWIVFVDDNFNREREDGETIYLVGDAADDGFQITSSQYRRRIGFLPTGMAFGSNVTVRFCPPNGANVTPRAIVISNSGRPRMTEIPADSC